MSVAERVTTHLPYLRRFARAVTGSQKSGDVSALDGDWHEVEKVVGNKAEGASPRRRRRVLQRRGPAGHARFHPALMLIRAYRARGHFYANLDPLGLEPHHNEEDLDPRSYGFTDADMDRPIFLDGSSGSEIGTLPRDR